MGRRGGFKLAMTLLALLASEPGLKISEHSSSISQAFRAVQEHHSQATPF